MMGMKQKTIMGKKAKNIRKNLRRRNFELNASGFTDDTGGSFASYYTNRAFSTVSEDQVNMFMPDPDVLFQFENDEHKKQYETSKIHGFEPVKLENIQSKIKFTVTESESKAAKARRKSKAFVGMKGEKVPYIFICPTLYRETYKEMETLMISILRLNRDQLTNPVQNYDFETNIFFDNCYVNGKNGKRTLNEYVLWFTEIMMHVSDSVKFDSELIGSKSVSKIEEPDVSFWPYGMRLEYKLPYPEDSISYTGEPNRVFVHLKDPEKIQKGKRWSQSMYFYYLLGYKFGSSEKIDRSKYDPMFLALDGDINFQPIALHSVLDKLRANPLIGICCGRIHPQGHGPIYHYQMFEYAVAHWLQKAAEHVLGCVLCSPGCFSLMRADALVRNTQAQVDSAISIYKSRPTDALSTVQWNQGEDGEHQHL